METRILKLRHALQLSIAQTDKDTSSQDENSNIIKVNNSSRRGTIISQNKNIDMNIPTTILTCVILDDNKQLEDKLQLLRKNLNLQFDEMKKKIIELAKRNNLQ